MDENTPEESSDEFKPEFDFEDYEIEEEVEETPEVAPETEEIVSETEEAASETTEGSTAEDILADLPSDDDIDAMTDDLPETPSITPTAPLDAPTAPGELQVTLVVEAGRVHVPLEQLLQMGEGNTLDLNVRPETGVDLVVDGQCVGRGELVKIGDHIGVKILDMG